MTGRESKRLGQQELALPSAVMAGLVPAIHVFPYEEKVVDARDKPGHDA